LRKYLRGSGSAAKYFYENLNPSTSAFHPENILLFSPSLLTGISITTASKTSVCVRSSLTVIWNESTAGGQWGTALKKTGYVCMKFMEVDEEWQTGRRHMKITIEDQFSKDYDSLLDEIKQINKGVNTREEWGTI
jgi:hypothetical protein